MTAQISERIHLNGKDLSLLSTPLCDYFALAKIESPFKGNCTALWRGYIGSWEVIDNRLYLVSVEAGFDDDNKTSLADIFPGFSNRVFAHWYSGELRIPIGNQLNYQHIGFASTYEKELFLELDSGVVVNERIEKNK
ncbi:hypothetical protein [Thalassotalea sp. Y01]|uniref:hypothetical protein n=1 Tax=Thalassotalea sp. Y01 TaxID=2729613 RepID=UPI00145CF2AD|nr:hypothetical protein [Thalassotalea sp. Y01]NMP16351.1 hypothetical protein [Thalassotalea sp. Y01]